MSFTITPLKWDLPESIKTPILKNTLYWERVYIKIKDERVVDDSLRVMYRADGRFSFAVDSDIEHLWQILKYEKGGHFVAHTDSKISANHLATGLLYPPHDFSRYEGGELVVVKNDQTEEIIRTSDFKQWTLIHLPIGVIHYVKPVTSGTRYVFKRAVMKNEYPIEPRCPEDDLRLFRLWDKLYWGIGADPRVKETYYPAAD